MSKLPVSVCIIARNEEKYLEGCLKKLQPYGFEIVVTDTGSTDNTKNIAAKYADKVLDFQWIDDFSAARNYCAAHASNNWILALDCDEYMESVDVPTLRIILQKYPRYAGVIRLKNLVIADDGHEGYGSDDVTRFYNRNFYRYQNPIHEQICPIDVSKMGETVQTVLLPMEVVHYGYLITHEEMEAKQRRNLALLYKSLENKPNDSYTLFQIAQSEFIIGNCEKAIGYYEKALSLNDDVGMLFVQVIITSLAKAYVVTGRQSEALELMLRYDGKCNSAKFLFVLASVYLDNNEPLKALLTYLKTVISSDVDTLGENLLHCYENIINIYNGLGKPEMAEKFRPKYEQCVKERERLTCNQGG